VGDGVVASQDRADVQDSRWILPPVDAELDFRVPARQWLMDRQSREGVVLDEQLDVETSGPIRRDRGADRLWERLLGRPRREHVDVLGRPLEQAVGLNGVAAGEGEAIACEHSEADVGKAFVEGVHKLRQAQAALVRSANRCSQARRTTAGRNNRPQHARRSSSLSRAVTAATSVASTKTRS
jgi:hypothetical protein